MIMAMILTCVVFMLFWMFYKYAISNAPFEVEIKWAMGVIAVLIAIAMIAGIWGLYPDGACFNFAFHDRFH